MIISNFVAYAQGTDGGAASPFSGLGTFVPLILMIVVFYFLLIRPQQKKEKDRKNMIQSLKKGDKVLTIGGVFGIIDDFRENDIVILRIASNTKAEFTRSAIQAKIS